MMVVTRAVLTVIIRKLSVNQLVHITPLVTPMSFSVSFSLISFSNTMLFTSMDAEYTHARTTKVGKMWLNIDMKLNTVEDRRWQQGFSDLMCLYRSDLAYHHPGK